jgi:hypothetical protein
MIGYTVTAFLVIMIPSAVFSAVISPDKPLSAQEIIDLSVHQAESQYRSFVEADYESEATTNNRSFDENDKITETEILRSRQYPLNGAVFEELIEKDGRPLNPNETEKENKKKRDFIREVEKRRTRGDYLQPQKEQAIRFNRDFTDRYLFELLKTERIRTYNCWVISFKPKEGKLPERGKMDRALNQLTGNLWVSQDDYGLVRVEFALRRPFKYWGGFLAVIRNTDGSADFTRVEPNVWLPLHFNLKLDIKVMMVKSVRRLVTKDWYNYRRVIQP